MYILTCAAGNMGGGAGRKSTKKPEEGDCVTLRWLCDHAHCTRCKEKRWRTPCQSKHHWAKLDAAEREEYRRAARRPGAQGALGARRVPTAAGARARVGAAELEGEGAQEPQSGGLLFVY